MGFLDQIAQKLAERQAERRRMEPPAGGMMVVAPATPGTMGAPGVTQMVPPGMPVAPPMPMGRPSYAVIDTGIRPAPVAEPPGFWDRFAAQQAGYLAKRR